MAHSGLIQRVEKTPDNKHGIKRIETIPGNEVCVLYLGGNRTNSGRDASGNAKIIEQEILPDLTSKVPLYAAYYDVSIEKMDADWKSNFSKYGYNFLTESAEDDFVWVNENNIEKVFRDKVLPKIVYKSNNELDIENTTEKLGKLHIIFDGYFFGLRNKMNQLLQKALTDCRVPVKTSTMIIKLITDNAKSNKDLDSEYIDTLFNQTILPRISDHGRRLPLDMAMARVRKINIVAHCHGAYLVQKLEEKMRAYMRTLGYTLTEINQVSSQILVVAHAPIIPLGVSKFRIISFTTLQDYFAERPKNWVTEYVRYKQKQETNNEIDIHWMSPCFLAGRNGNVFIIRNAFEPRADNGRPSQNEHYSAHYQSMPDQTEQGELMNQIAHNILVNGIKNSLAKEFTPLPSIEELVLGDDDREYMQEYFILMKSYGKEFMQDVFKFAIEHFKEKHPTQLPKRIAEIKR